MSLPPPTGPEPDDTPGVDVTNSSDGGFLQRLFKPWQRLFELWRGGAHVEVSNPSDGGFFHWLLKFYLFGLLCVLGAMGLTAFGAYIYFAATLPDLPAIATYHQITEPTTVVRAWDGTPL